MKAKKVTKLYVLLAKKLYRKRFQFLLLTGIVFSWATIGISFYTYTKKDPEQKVLGAQISNIGSVAAKNIISPVVEITIFPTQPLTSTPTLSPSAKPTPKPTTTPIPKNSPQYTAQRVNDVTWRVTNTQNDDNMASPQDIFNALNSYRGAHGLPNLSWDTGLASYAQGRADLFSKNGSLDSHAGFNEFMNNGGFDKVGFNGLGENSAYLSGNMNGEHIIKNIFGADSSHDGNQLDPSWTNVGIGVSGVAVNVNFGKNKK